MILFGPNPLLSSGHGGRLSALDRFVAFKSDQQTEADRPAADRHLVRVTETTAHRHGLEPRSPKTQGTQRRTHRRCDSQVDGHPRTSANPYRSTLLGTELQMTLADFDGSQARGLQNCLRGAAEASWVGSIPIHPRFPNVSAPGPESRGTGTPSLSNSTGAPWRTYCNAAVTSA